MYLSFFANVNNKIPLKLLKKLTKQFNTKRLNCNEGLKVMQTKLY